MTTDARASIRSARKPRYLLRLTVLAVFVFCSISAGRSWPWFRVFFEDPRIRTLTALLWLGGVSSQASGIVRHRSDNQLGWAAIWMSFPLFTIYSDLVARGSPAILAVPGAITLAVFIGIVIGSFQQRRVLALWCIWLAGGVTASTVLWAWLNTPSG
jgi:hypothetical protein